MIYFVDKNKKENVKNSWYQKLMILILGSVDTNVNEVIDWGLCLFQKTWMLYVAENK